MKTASVFLLTLLSVGVQCSQVLVFPSQTIEVEGITLDLSFSLDVQVLKEPKKITADTEPITNNIVTDAPGKPIIEDKKLHFAIVEVNQTATSYNQLVKNNNAALVSVKWHTLDGGPVKTSRVLLNDTDFWTGDGSATLAVFNVSRGGIYQMKVELCNSLGCSYSDAKEVVVADTDGSHLSSLSFKFDRRNKLHQQTSGKVAAAFFDDRAPISQDSLIRSLPYLTHILYLFLAICGGNGINDSLKRDAGLFEKLQQSCDGREAFKITIPDLSAAFSNPKKGLESSDGPYEGNFGQLMVLKQMKPELKIIATIGGWYLSDPFYFLNDTAKRDNFVTSVKDFLQTWKFFDGVSIRWEDPGGNGANSRLGSRNDGRVYVQLLKELREMLHDLSAETGKQYELNSNIAAATWKINAVDYWSAEKYIDYFFLMNIGYKGSWSNTELGHCAALYAPAWDPKESATTEGSLKWLLNQGVDPEKIVIGTTSYGKGWAGVHNYTDNNVFTGIATCGWMSTNGHGFISYSNIAKELEQDKWEYYYDDVAEAPYIFQKQTGDLITFDDLRSTAAKAKYVVDKQLGGMFVSEFTGDNGELVTTMYIGLRNKTSGNNSHEIEWFYEEY